MLTNVGEAYATYSPVIALALAVVVFATAPLVIYLLRNKEFTKREFLVIGVECSWILFANALCALSSVDYFLMKYGRTHGLLLTILTTAFGGTIALGMYEVVLNKRLAIGRMIERKVLNFLTTNVEEPKDSKTIEKGEENDADC